MPYASTRANSVLSVNMGYQKNILGGALVYRLGAYEPTCTHLATPLGASVTSLGGYMWVHMVWYGRVTITLLNISEGLLLHDYTF